MHGLQQPRQADRATDTNHDPHDREQDRLPDDQSDDGPAARAERHANADLPRALRDQVRQHAEDADRGEGERDRREHREQQHASASSTNAPMPTTRKISTRRVSIERWLMSRIPR